MKRSGSPPRVKRGSARVALVLLALVALAAWTAAWIWTQPGENTGAAGPGTGPADTVASSPQAPSGASSVDASDFVRRDADPLPAPNPADDPLRFRGRGRIRGEIRAEGIALPTHWTLVLEPDPMSVGAEHATSRRVEFANGETRFDLEDLPLGGYRVRAEVTALNSTRAPALLARGASDVFVTVYLARAGLVDGFVFDAEGHAAEGFPVTLEDLGTRARQRTEVDAAGAFVVHDVVDGEYQIFFGEPDAPLVEPETFTFRAPTMRWPATNLPPTGSARIRVLDAIGAPFFEAQLVGSGSPRGLLRGQTGSDGAWIGRYLAPGRYHVTATTADGRTGRIKFAVESAVRTEVELRLD